jgi:Lrp/AsnC family transcriptional regulator for asnA, asnC and gidA
VICNHYKALKSAGIIVGSTIQFNYPKFGYSAVAIIKLSLDSQYIPETLEHLKTIPNIISFCNYNSPYSIIAISTLKNLRDLDYAKEIMSKQNQTNEIKTSLWTDVRNIPENVLSGDFENKTENADEKGSPAGIVKIGEIDLQIVEKLAQNGRVPFSKIAQEISISTDNISRRYEKLVRNNFIKISIQFNPIKLGYQSILEINVAVADQSETNKIVDKLSKIKGVSYIVKLSGSYDLSLVALVKSRNY